MNGRHGVIRFVELIRLPEIILGQTRKYRCQGLGVCRIRRNTSSAGRAVFRSRPSVLSRSARIAFVFSSNSSLSPGRVGCVDISVPLPYLLSSRTHRESSGQNRGSRRRFTYVTPSGMSSRSAHIPKAANSRTDLGRRCDCSPGTSISTLVPSVSFTSSSGLKTPSSNLAAMVVMFVFAIPKIPGWPTAKEPAAPRDSYAGKILYRPSLRFRTPTVRLGTGAKRSSAGHEDLVDKDRLTPSRLSRPEELKDAKGGGAFIWSRLRDNGGSRG